MLENIIHYILGDNPSPALIWGQIFGIGVFFGEAWKLIAKTKKRILFANTIANVFYLLQYAALGAWTGSISVIVTFIRNYIFEKYRQKKEKSSNTCITWNTNFSNNCKYNHL